MTPTDDITETILSAIADAETEVDRELTDDERESIEDRILSGLDEDEPVVVAMNPDHDTETGQFAEGGGSQARAREYLPGSGEGGLYKTAKNAVNSTDADDKAYAEIEPYLKRVYGPSMNGNERGFPGSKDREMDTVARLLMDVARADNDGGGIVPIRNFETNGLESFELWSKGGPFVEIRRDKKGRGLVVDGKVAKKLIPSDAPIEEVAKLLHRALGGRPPKSLEASLGYIAAHSYTGERQVPDRVRLGGGAVVLAAGERGSYQGLAYSGGPLTLKEFNGVPVVVDLQGVQIEAQDLPNFLNHDEDDEVGRTSSITVHPTKGITIAGKCNAGSDDGDMIIAAGKGGKKWEFSIGAPVHEMEEYGPGENVTVNGREFLGPVLVARKTTLKEVSFVHRGGDVGKTYMTIAARLGEPSINRCAAMLESMRKSDAALVARLRNFN